MPDALKMTLLGADPEGWLTMVDFRRFVEGLFQPSDGRLMKAAYAMVGEGLLDIKEIPVPKRDRTWPSRAEAKTVLRPKDMTGNDPWLRLQREVKRRADEARRVDEAARLLGADLAD